MARVNRLLLTTLADMVPSLVKDPRVQQPAMVTVVEVRATPDLRYAKVYVSVVGESREQESAAIDALRQAKGFLRGELGRRIKLRYTPELQFTLDTGMEAASRVEEILRELKEDA